MICGGCGNQNATRTRSGKDWEYCNVCGEVGNSGVSDVFWKPGMEEHGLPDDPKTGKPMVFNSKGEKARYLSANNLVEAGDRMRGAPASILREQGRKENNREVALQALHHVKQMGQDRRREEFNRLRRESGRF